MQARDQKLAVLITLCVVESKDPHCCGTPILFQLNTRSSEIRNLSICLVCLNSSHNGSTRFNFPSPAITNRHSQSRDSSRNQLHLHASRHADLFEEFNRLPLQPDSIYLPPQHQPINPEDEDDVVPDQHAAFGIAKATRDTREAGWRDLRLSELVAGDVAGHGSGANGIGGGAADRAATDGSRVERQQNGVVASQTGQPVVGPARGPVGVPVGVRQGMRAVGTNGVGSSLRS